MLSSSDRWNQLETLFHKSLELEPEARSAFLDDSCGEDTELRKELDALLDEVDKPTNILEQPVFEAAHSVVAESHRNAINPGTRISHYEIISLLATGGMGQVYLAEDTSLQRQVAFKVLTSEFTADDRGLRRLEREARAASALNHPNIVTVYEFGQINGLHFIASEFVDGPTLRQRLSNGRLDLNTTLNIAIQVAGALAAAHASGIVHLDVKPENVMIRSDGLVKVLDFGIAKPTAALTVHRKISAALTSITEPGMVIGTVGYMSPEQVRGKPTDHRADIFAFGAILYEMLAGKRAFQRSTSAETMTAILNDDPPAISQIVQSTPPELQRVVHRCLEKNPEQRFQSVSDLAFSLEALSESSSGPAAGIGARGQRRRVKALVLSGGLVTVLVLAAVAYFFVARQRSVPFEHYSIQKVIDSERVRMVTISPDGNYLAAVVNDPNGAQRLVLHHIPTNSEHPIVEDTAYSYEDITFSPDGSYIYFRIGAISPPQLGGQVERLDRDDVYRIPILGGQPTRVIVGVDGPLSFIDEGRRACFYREDLPRTADTYKLLSASLDGGDEHVLAKGKGGFTTSVACAPNGRSAVIVDGLGNVESLDFASGPRRAMAASSPAPFGRLADLRWAPDGKGLFVTSSNRTHPRGQIGFLFYPGENLYQITNDVNDYSGISLTADARTIATTQRDNNARFAELSLVGPSHLLEHQTGGLSLWFTWLDKDRIVETDTTNSLGIVNLLTDESVTLDVGKGHWLRHPALCGPDTLVASGGTLEGDSVSVYKMHLDGSGLTQLTKGPNDYFPECTADGKWLFYVDDREPENPVLMRQAVQGGAAQKVMTANVWYSLSPNGKFLAVTTHGYPNAELQIMSVDSLQKIQSFPFTITHTHPYVAFSLDNKSVFYTTKIGLDTTIWRQPLDAVTPVKVMTLPGKEVEWISPSPDGKKLGLILTTPTSEAVLLYDRR